MSAVAVVLVGKSGDILNALPVGKHLHNQGHTVNFIVNTQYVPTLLGASYVKPEGVHFGLGEVEKAIKYAKSKYETVYMAHTWGRHWRGPRTQPYNLTSWLNCGLTREQFEDTTNFPLTLDLRDQERENFLCGRHRSDKPVLLVSVGCNRSSPFSSHWIFIESIKRKWGNIFKVIDLCDIKAARIYDLLGLFDRARLLITADSSPLHLATAAPGLKVIALLNDDPWMGSLPRYTPILTLRYSQVIQSMGRVHEAVGSTLHVRPDGSGARRN